MSFRANLALTLQGIGMVDRAAAAVGQWLDWARAELGQTQRDLMEMGEAFGPDAPPRRPAAAPPWFACPKYGQLLGSRRKDAEFMQNRCPVGRGPSSKTWPRCESQRAQRTSVRTIP